MCRGVFREQHGEVIKERWRMWGKKRGKQREGKIEKDKRRDVEIIIVSVQISRLLLQSDTTLTCNYLQ